MKSFTILLVLTNVFFVESVFRFPWFGNNATDKKSTFKSKSCDNLSSQSNVNLRSPAPRIYIPSKPIPIPLIKGTLASKQRPNIVSSSVLSSKSYGEEDDENEHPELFPMSCDPELAVALKAGEERKKIAKLTAKEKKKAEQQQQNQNPQKSGCESPFKCSYFNEQDAIEAENALNIRRAQFRKNSLDDDEEKDSDFDGDIKNCYSLSI